MKANNEKKRLNDKSAYFYIKNIKRCMPCPSCKKGKMTFVRKTSYWECKSCQYSFTEEMFLKDCTLWFCDECEAFLNGQDGFDSNASQHICKNCRHENTITANTAKKICFDCGKIIDNLNTIHCSDCIKLRSEKTKKILVTAGAVAAGIVAAAGAVIVAVATMGSEEKDENESSSDDIDENSNNRPHNDSSVKYKVVFDGEEEDEVFDTEEAAEDYALYLCSCSREGAEILHMSNPGDYEYDEDEYESPEYEVLEIEDW